MQVYRKEHKYILFQPKALQKPSHKSHTQVHKGTEYKICSWRSAVLLKLAGIINKMFKKQLPTKGLWRTKVGNSSSLTIHTFDLLLSLELFLFLLCFSFLLLFVRFLVHLFVFSKFFLGILAAQSDSAAASQMSSCTHVCYLVSTCWYAAKTCTQLWNIWDKVTVWISVQINSQWHFTPCTSNKIFTSINNDDNKIITMKNKWKKKPIKGPSHIF